MLIETLFLVPATDNDGKSFAPRFWRQLNERLLREFGGYSRTENMQGVWRADDGQLYQDQSIQYLVGLSSIRQISGWLAIVDWVQRAARQEAIYVRLGPFAEIYDSR